MADIFAFSQTLRRIKDYKPQVVSDAFLDWVLNADPETAVKMRSALNRGAVGTLDTYVAWIGSVPPNAKYTQEGRMIVGIDDPGLAYLTDKE